jgi:hypothetical protein
MRIPPLTPNRRYTSHGALRQSSERCSGEFAPGLRQESTMAEMIDLAPLVSRLESASRAGKLSWEPTADRSAFVASLGESRPFAFNSSTKRRSTTGGSPTRTRHLDSTSSMTKGNFSTTSKVRQRTGRCYGSCTTSLVGLEIDSTSASTRSEKHSTSWAVEKRGPRVRTA